jgi:hypothetical protein
MSSDQNKSTDFGTPMFLGIGVPKGATTWLYDLLDTHPDVWLAQGREIHFFDRKIYFSRGLTWYRKFFPEISKWNTFKAIGEITPSYLYIDESKIKYISEELPGINKLICIVRNPIERTHSDYNFQKRLGKVPNNIDFDHFLLDPSSTIEAGMYSKYLSKWLNYYRQDQILILVFEEIFQDITSAKMLISEFLEIDHNRFPETAGREKANERFVPKFPKLYSLAVRATRFMHDLGLYPVVRNLKRIGLKSLLSIRKKEILSAPITSETRQRLQATFKDDVATLESILGRKITTWKDF